MNPQIVLRQELKQIVVRGGPIVANILPFSVVATQNGQVNFTLPYAYSQIICFFILGTGQDPLIGDYTLSGNVATLGVSAPTIEIGDVIFGSGQI